MAPCQLNSFRQSFCLYSVPLPTHHLLYYPSSAYLPAHQLQTVLVPLQVSFCLPITLISLCCSSSISLPAHYLLAASYAPLLPSCPHYLQIVFIAPLVSSCLLTTFRQSYPLYSVPLPAHHLQALFIALPASLCLSITFSLYCPSSSSLLVHPLKFLLAPWCIPAYLPSSAGFVTTLVSICLPTTFRQSILPLQCLAACPPSLDSFSCPSSVSLLDHHLHQSLLPL